MNRYAHILSGKGLSYLLLTLIVATAPLYVTNRYWMHILILICIWSIAAQSLNLIMGYAGQGNLAMGAFFGIGAYATALFMLKAGFGFWPALILSALFTSFVGVLIGLPTLRTTGSYFAIGTLCFNVIVFIAVERWETLTEGARGIMGIPHPAPINLPFGVTISFDSLSSMYYLVLVFLIATIFVVSRLINSLVGRSFLAVKENPELTSSIGINPMRVKLLAFVASTFLASIAGSLYAVYIGFLDPESASYHVTFEVLLYVVIGGLATIAGPIIGAVVVTLVGEFLHYLDAFRLVAYGLVLIVFILFLPEGILGVLKNVWAKMQAKYS